MKRRHFLFGSAGVILLGGALLRPDDKGAGYDSYFGSLNEMLKRLEVGVPSMLIDIARLQANALQLISHIHDIGRHYRIVSKSLPSVGLIRQVMEFTGSNRVMVFQQPFMNQVAKAFPDSDLLLGKPMPVDAAERFYALLEGGFNPDKQLQWLIDTPERLDEYLALAKKLGRRLRVNIEIDVGLHRGGLTEPQQLDAIMATIKANAAHLEFAGFMGYDGHVAHIPEIIESAEETHQRSNATYQSYIDYLFAHYPEQKQRDDLTFNGAGSPSVMLHGKDTPLTELSAGSCLIKPSDFDLASLKPFQPAAFIATPVLKEWDGLKMPGPGNIPLGELWQLWDVNREKTFFIYGGYWKAKPVSPPGLTDNSLYGYSSNQMMYNGSDSVPLEVGDYIFLRPTQSEAVLRHFGDLLAYKGNHLAHWWPPYTQDFTHT